MAHPHQQSHVNNFVKTYPYKYIEITPELVPECLQLESKWFKANSGGDDEQELNDERRSMIYALNHCEELGLRGGAICVNHQIVAFSFGAPITYNTFGVHAHLVSQCLSAQLHKKIVDGQNLRREKWLNRLFRKIFLKEQSGTAIRKDKSQLTDVSAVMSKKGFCYLL